MTSIAQLIKASEYICTGRYPVQASAVFLNELLISDIWFTPLLYRRCGELDGPAGIRLSSIRQQPVAAAANRFSNQNKQNNLNHRQSEESEEVLYVQFYIVTYFI